MNLILRIVILLAFSILILSSNLISEIRIGRVGTKSLKINLGEDIVGFPGKNTEIWMNLLMIIK